MRVYTIKEFAQDIKVLACIVKESKDWRHIQDIYGIPRGGLAIALWLSHYLNKPLIMKQNQIGIHTLVVDDIADCGHTLAKLQPKLSLTIFLNPSSIFKPNFWLREKHDRWVRFPWETKDSTRTKQQGTRIV